MPSIYLDTCCLQRPLDDQTQPRIRVETEAVLGILVAVQAGEVQMFSSDALDYEISRIPDYQRRQQARSMLSLAATRLNITEAAENLAESLERQGIRPMDAIHLALASVAGADFFATCDRRFLARARQSTGLGCSPLSVFELLLEISP